MGQGQGRGSESMPRNPPFFPAFAEQGAWGRAVSGPPDRTEGQVSGPQVRTQTQMAVALRRPGNPVSSAFLPCTPGPPLTWR